MSREDAQVAVEEPAPDPLSQIIRDLNERHGLQLGAGDEIVRRMAERWSTMRSSGRRRPQTRSPTSSSCLAESRGEGARGPRPELAVLRAGVRRRRGPRPARGRAGAGGVRTVDRRADVALETLDGDGRAMLSTAVQDRDWLAERREIEDFFVRDVDREKIVLFGGP